MTFQTEDCDNSIVTTIIVTCKYILLDRNSINIKQGQPSPWCTVVKTNFYNTALHNQSYSCVWVVWLTNTVAKVTNRSKFCAEYQLICEYNRVF